MPEVICTTVYQFPELSDAAKEKARSWYRELGPHDDWWEAVYEDFERICQILGIHLKRRRFDPTDFDLSALSKATDGFSGAEIEQAIVAAMYEAHARKAPLETSYLLDEIGRTRPLSMMMAEKVDALRAWAMERCVPAN